MTIKHYGEPSVFTPKNLLREARRQKNLEHCKVPEVCVLDPDGDLVEYFIKTKQGTLNKCWACYHTRLYTVRQNGFEFGVLGCAVGSSFAVLVAEQLFVSGCETLISITSAGIINSDKQHAKFILIQEAIRDEGTSFHYMAPSKTSFIHSDLLKKLTSYYGKTDLSINTGISWTTDAPYRETVSAIEEARNENAVCVEMEAAALYAFATARNKNVICFAHLTNTMAQTEGDFEKGEEMGSLDTMELIIHTIKALIPDISDHWNTIYTLKQPHEVSWTQQKPEPSLRFIHSFNLSREAAIIDVGGGDSQLVDYLLQEGFKNITVLDISAAALERARKRLGSKAQQVNWIVSDITQFQPQTTYEVWHDRAAFHFLRTNDSISSYLSILEKAVTGFLIMGTFSDNGPEKCSGLPVHRYSEQDLTALLQKDFQKIACFTEDHVTPFNTLQIFLFCSFKRR